jgi:hypothetical protein
MRKPTFKKCFRESSLAVDDIEALDASLKAKFLRESISHDTSKGDT